MGLEGGLLLVRTVASEASDEAEDADWRGLPGVVSCRYI
jgi:hypothetical protein